jgi:acyl-coenzyme A thioesterase PaaI-like protein
MAEETPPPTYDTAALADRMTQFVPHAAALGMTLISVAGGKGVMSLDWREDLVGDPETGVIASGVVTALIDHTCGLAINSVFDMPQPIATLDLRIDYLRPAAPRTGITCEAFGYKTTRSVGFVRAEAWDVDRGDLVATAQAAFMLNPRG